MYAVLTVNQNAKIIDNLQWCCWSKINQYFSDSFFFYILVILETEVDANWKNPIMQAPVSQACTFMF